VLRVDGGRLRDRAASPRRRRHRRPLSRHPPAVRPYSPAVDLVPSGDGPDGASPYKLTTNTGGSEETMAGLRRVAIETAQASTAESSVESPKIDPAPLNVVRMTPPVEATLRILLNSVPYLIGAAVVRQPAVGDAVEAEVGRMPWLHDRRLLTLQLPDDSLPANRAILLDWPVPYQAEWVGVPPRLLISRLVTQDRTVGLLLGPLISRDQISTGAREALDLSCELIAAAVGSDSLATLSVPAPVDEPRRLVVVPDEAMPEPESSLVIAAPAESEPVLDPKDEADAHDRRVVDYVGRTLDELPDRHAYGRG